MIRFAAVLCLFALPVMAQDLWSVPASSDPDDLEARESSEGHFCEIRYDNSATLSSTSGTHVLTCRDPDTEEVADITVQIEVGGQEVDGAEIIRVTPPDYLFAVPDYAEVPDGEVFIIQIQRPMS